MKTITFFVNQSLESPCGVGRYFPMAKELVKRGHKVNVIALHHHYESLKQKEFVKDRVNVYYAGQMHVLKIGDKKIYMNKFQLAKTILFSTLNMLLKGLRLKTDIVYLFKPQPITGTAAFFTRLLKGNKFYIDCDDYEAQTNKFSSKLEQLVFALFENNLPRFADKITVHNTFLKNRYIELGINKDKLIFLPNGIDRERFKNITKEKTTALKKRLGIKNEKIILYFGSLSLKSGHSVDLLLRAFAELKGKITNSRLLIVGGGEDLDKLKSSALELKLGNVDFIGRVDPSEIPNYINISDVTIDPVHDTLANKARCPLKLFESMALGTPVITSDVGDRSLFAQNGKSALLVKPGDYKELAAGIIKILKDKSLAKNISKSSLKTSKNYYWDKLVKELDHNLIASNTSSG